MKYAEEIYLAPRDYCGYIPLMNSGPKKNQNNCKSITGIINGRLRIIIYSIKTIQLGEELLYSYGESFHYQWFYIIEI